MSQLACLTWQIPLRPIIFTAVRDARQVTLQLSGGSSRRVMNSPQASTTILSRHRHSWRVAHSTTLNAPKTNRLSFKPCRLCLPTPASITGEVRETYEPSRLLACCNSSNARASAEESPAPLQRRQSTRDGNAGSTAFPSLTNPTAVGDQQHALAQALPDKGFGMFRVFGALAKI